MSASPALPVRHIVREAAATYRAESWRVLGIALLFIIPTELLTFLGDRVREATDRQTVEAIAVLALASLGGTIVSNLGAAFYVGLLDHTVHARRHGARPEPIGAIARKLPYWRMVGVALLSGLLVAAGFLLLVLPGFVLMTLFAIAAPVVVLEGTGVIAGLRRSAQLVRPQLWRVFAVITVPLVAEGYAVDAVADFVGH